jgi:hypothetical protein
VAWDPFNNNGPAAPGVGAEHFGGGAVADDADAKATAGALPAAALVQQRAAA